MQSCRLHGNIFPDSRTLWRCAPPPQIEQLKQLKDPRKKALGHILQSLGNGCGGPYLVSISRRRRGGTHDLLWESPESNFPLMMTFWMFERSIIISFEMSFWHKASGQLLQVGAHRASWLLVNYFGLETMCIFVVFEQEYFQLQKNSTFINSQFISDISPGRNRQWALKKLMTNKCWFGLLPQIITKTPDLHLWLLCSTFMTFNQSMYAWLEILFFWLGTQDSQFFWLSNA